jgi:hypothetical protein
VPTGEPQGIGRFMAGLDAQGMTVDVVNLLDAPLPADTDLVIVAGPKRDFLPEELEKLATHLKAGGGLLLLLDPGTLPSLQAFLGTMGIALGDDFVVDHERRVLATDGLAAVVEEFRSGNPISDGEESDRNGVVLPSARTVDVVRDVPGVSAETSPGRRPRRWAMADAGRARRGEEPSKRRTTCRGRCRSS